MNLKKLVQISNSIGIISILLLVYWVFIFIVTMVFGLKVFRQTLSETFFMSILGILALMVGALIINIMFNLTRIAQKHNQDAEVPKNNKVFGWVFTLSFPLILGLLFCGNYLTVKKKEQLLIQSARSVVKDNPQLVTKMINYSFTQQWLITTNDALDIISKTDKNFPTVAVIVLDTIGESRFFLKFHNYYKDPDDSTAPEKKNYIMETTKPERDYLYKVFDQKNNGIRFTADEGNYEMYYPFTQNGKTVVFYFSDYQRYGKIGS